MGATPAMQLQNSASTKFRAPISLCLVALVAVYWPPAPLATQEPVLLGRIEQAFAQPTAFGRAIATLQVFDGRLYAGYGDFTADTGPIAIVPVDPATGRIGVSLLSYATEAVYGFRQIGDELFAADIDPRGTRQGGFARGVSRDGAHVWTGSQYAVVDLTAAGETAFVLNRRQEEWSSTDLVNWRLRATFTGPAGERATSLAVSGNNAYVGTSGSNIYRMALAR